MDLPIIILYTVLYFLNNFQFSLVATSTLSSADTASFDVITDNATTTTISSSHLFSISNLLNKTCTETSGCNNNQASIQYSHCNIHYGLCACNHGYRPSSNGTTCTNNGHKNKMVHSTISSTNTLKNWMQKMPMAPILVVLISMFICMCLVLQLFSKARFRNANRSIFVNPQKLELAKAQERRMSQLSQLSGIGAGVGSGLPRTPRKFNIEHCSLPSSIGSRSARNSFGSSIGYPPPMPSSSFVNSFDHLNHSADSSVIVKTKSRSNSISSSKLL